MMDAARVLKCMVVLSVIFCYGCCVQFNVCSDRRKNLPCNMTCETADFSQTIQFNCNGTLRGSCVTFGCGANLVQEAPGTTILTIPSLSYSNDIGEWTCSYGSTNSPTINVIVYGNPSPPNITLQTNLDANAENVENVEFTAVLECAYPSTPSVILEFAEVGKGTYQTFKSVQPSVSAPTVGQCSDNLESIVTAEIKASYNENDEAFAGKTGLLRAKFFYTTDVQFISSSIGPFKFKGSTTTESTINLSTDIITTTNSETSNELSTESLSTTQSSISLLQSTIEGSTFSGRTETSTSPVTLTSPSGLSEEMIIIISTVSSVGGILLIVIIVVVLCCRKSAAKSEENRNKHDKLHIKNDKNKDLNSNNKHSQKIKQHAHSGRKIQGGAYSYQKHPQNIWYEGRMPTGLEYSRSQKYHQQNYFPRNQHHYRNQDSAYYLPYTDPRNVMYHQRYPESRYYEDISGYSRGGPNRMHQFYPETYPRKDRYTEDGLERRIGHRRGEYGGYWDDTLF